MTNQSKPIKYLNFNDVYPHTKGSKEMTREEKIQLAHSVHKPTTSELAEKIHFIYSTPDVYQDREKVYVAELIEEYVSKILEGKA